MNRIVMRRAALAAACLCAALLGTTPRAAGPAIRYVADPGPSRLEFSGVQGGAEFKGVFHKFTAVVV
ncbi:MAG TPA: hypothetical protein VK251_04335, partial [Steroidobacteraceae bacterium]|nr:hypothetical protein [Steroidobacteraceae bacterium]